MLDVVTEMKRPGPRPISLAKLHTTSIRHPGEDQVVYIRVSHIDLLEVLALSSIPSIYAISPIPFVDALTGGQRMTFRQCAAGNGRAQRRLASPLLVVHRLSPRGPDDFLFFLRRSPRTSRTKEPLRRECGFGSRPRIMKEKSQACNPNEILHSPSERDS